jgi:hypothetical protein
MIERAESIHAQLQGHRLAERNRAKYGGVVRNLRRSTIDGLAHIAKDSADWRAESGRIEPRMVRSNPTQFLERTGLIRHLNVARRIQFSGARSERKRCSGPSTKDVAHLPSTSNSAR